MDIGKAKQKETLKQNVDSTVLPIVGKTEDKPVHNTQKLIAEELGWSKGKVSMADRVWKEAEPEVLEKVLTNEITGKVAKWRKRDG